MPSAQSAQLPTLRKPEASQRGWVWYPPTELVFLHCPSSLNSCLWHMLCPLLAEGFKSKKSKDCMRNVFTQLWGLDGESSGVFHSMDVIMYGIGSLNFCL